MLRWRKKKTSSFDQKYNGLIVLTSRQLSSKSTFYLVPVFKMNRIILSVLAVAFCFAVGQALQCYQCRLGLGDLCITTKTTCDSGKHCFSGVGTAAGFLDIKMKGCLAVAECNQTKEVNFPSSGSNSTNVYSMTKTCCDSDLCNAAPGLPGTSGLGLALATMTALFVANALV